MNSEAAWTFPGPIIDMLAKGLVGLEPGTAGCDWYIIGEWDDAMGPTKTHTCRLKTDSGWVTIRRLEGT